MKKLFKIILLLIILVIPAALFFAPLPFENDWLIGKKLIIPITLYGLIATSFLSRIFLAKKPSIALALGFTTTILSIYFVIGLIVPTLLPPYPWNLLVLLSCLILLSVFIGIQSIFSSSGMIGFALVLLSLLSVELVMRRIPKEALAKNVRTTPPIVKPDQVNIIYKQNWFRGKKPCFDCSEDLIRIVTMGGSSTYGVPMHFSTRAYAAELQRLLDERRPGEQYEVLNGGVAAMGMMQIISALNEEILKYKPNIVTVCEWFNDSAPQPRWYRIPGISDKEAYKRDRSLRRLQEFPVYKQIRESKLFAVLRHYILKTRDSFSSIDKSVKKVEKKKTKRSNRPRMNLEEYRWALEEIVRMGKEHDFMPVFIIESFHRTNTIEQFTSENGYVKTMFDVAKEHGVLVVDPVTPMSKIPEPWLFYDFIHPNYAGHRIIAEELFDTLFSENQTTWSKDFWNKRKIEVKKPNALKKPIFQYSKTELAGKLLEVRARAPYSSGEANLSLFLDETKFESKKNLTNKFETFSFEIDELEEKDPIIDVSFSAGIPILSNQKDFTIGKSKISSPVFIEAKSGGKDHGWTVAIKVNGKRFDYDLRGYNVVIIGAKSGKIKSTKLFDFYIDETENKKLSDYLNNLENFYEDGLAPIVVIAVKTDGHYRVDKELISPLLKNLGGSGQIVDPFESFLLIGSPGLAPGTAIEEVGKKLIKIETGDKNLLASALIEIEKIDLIKNKQGEAQ